MSLRLMSATFVLLAACTTDGDPVETGEVSDSATAGPASASASGSTNGSSASASGGSASASSGGSGPSGGSAPTITGMSGGSSTTMGASADGPTTTGGSSILCDGDEDCDAGWTCFLEPGCCAGDPGFCAPADAAQCGGIAGIPCDVGVCLIPDGFCDDSFGACVDPAYAQQVSEAICVDPQARGACYCL